MPVFAKKDDRVDTYFLHLGNATPVSELQEVLSGDPGLAAAYHQTYEDGNEANNIAFRISVKMEEQKLIKRFTSGQFHEVQDAAKLLAPKLVNPPTGDLAQMKVLFGQLQLFYDLLGKFLELRR